MGRFLNSFGLVGLLDCLVVVVEVLLLLSGMLHCNIAKYTGTLHIA